MGLIAAKSDLEKSERISERKRGPKKAFAVKKKKGYLISSVYNGIPL